MATASPAALRAGTAAAQRSRPGGANGRRRGFPLRGPARACPAGGRCRPCASSGQQPRRGPPRCSRGCRKDCFRNPFCQQPLTPPANVYSAARS